MEKIAASWRLRRLHRWQAQLFEDDTLTEDTRLDKLDKVLRHETALQRQIDTAVRMLAKDVPQLYARRAREEALERCQLSERECQADGELDMGVAMETRNRLYQLRKATNQAVNELSVASLDTPAVEASEQMSSEEEAGDGELAAEVHEICRNERVSASIRSYRLHGKSGTYPKSGTFLAPRSGAS